MAKSYSFDTPAIFIEFDLGTATIGMQGVTFYPDTLLSFHLVETLLNAGDTMEQNLPIFDTRDLIKKTFNGAQISFCSSMMCVSDKQDFKHDNVYKYVITFKTQFIDNSGSNIDKGENYSELINPTLEVNIFLGENITTESKDIITNENGEPFILE